MEIPENLTTENFQDYLYKVQGHAYLNGAVDIIGSLVGALNMLEINSRDPQIGQFVGAMSETCLQLKAKLVEAFEGEGITLNG